MLRSGGIPAFFLGGAPIIPHRNHKIGTFGGLLQLLGSPASLAGKGEVTSRWPQGCRGGLSGEGGDTGGLVEEIGRAHV